MTISGKTTSKPSSTSGDTPVQLDLFIPEDQLSSPILRQIPHFFSVPRQQEWRNLFMRLGMPFTIASILPAGTGDMSRPKPSRY